MHATSEIDAVQPKARLGGEKFGEFTEQDFREHSPVTTWNDLEDADRHCCSIRSIPREELRYQIPQIAPSGSSCIRIEKTILSFPFD